MSALLLRLSGVRKTYPPTVQSSQRFRAFLQILARGRSQGGTTVLQDINLEVRRGESLALIGANGAGKSTLLKIITGVLAPSAGSVERHGSQAALLELGAGFDPEYTGLENLRLNAALLGMSRREVEEKLDDILAFADIGDSIHEPVKHYSSGMVVRLGFAIIAAVSPDLLITDEILAVGDESFQKKCIRWIEQYLDQGGTMLMVSHNMYHVQKLCRHALWLEKGRPRAMGDVHDVVQSYLAWHERKDAAQTAAAVPASPHLPSVKALDITAPTNDPAVLGDTGDLAVRAVISSPDGRPPVVLFGIVRADGTPVFGISSEEDRIKPLQTADGAWQVSVRFRQIQLMPGDYFVRVCAMDPEGLRACDNHDIEFSVRYPTRQQGLVRLQYEWLPAGDGRQQSQT